MSLRIQPYQPYQPYQPLPVHIVEVYLLIRITVGNYLA